MKKNRYIWVIITPEDTIYSYKRAGIENVFKKMDGNREFRRYKDGIMDKVIDSKYNDNYVEDSTIIMHRGFDIFNPSPNFSQRLLD